MEQRSMMLNNLSNLPRKMLLLHDLDAIAELVLHELCSERCFNLNKAVYFVDNPDFDCMKGVAGFSRDESYKGGEHMWEDPHAFTQYIKTAPFNQKVRTMHHPSMQRNKTEDDKVIRSLADDCAIAHPECHMWDMKHNNRGVFIYEKPEAGDVGDYLHNGVCLLSFCPIN